MKETLPAPLEVIKPLMKVQGRKIQGKKIQGKKIQEKLNLN